jgi:NADH:ubiquinone oxidoreductase subunit F (NADH-binding)
MTITTDAGLAERAAADLWRQGALIGPAPAAQLDLRAHVAEHGVLPALRPDDIVRLAADAALTGHGGAGFPLWRKLEAVNEARGRTIVVGNGAEGEPASAKDRWLLAHRPHLVLDGLQLVARATRASEAYLYVNERAPYGRLSELLTERGRAAVDRLGVELVLAPDLFVAGEESAVVNRLAGGAAIPRSKPPRVIERGLRGRPTLVSNVETLALLALIARRGAGWFRDIGTTDSPGTMLFTVSGAVRRPGVVEAAHGTPLHEIVDLAGGPSGRLQAVLLGGYHGSWLTAAEAGRARMSRTDLAAFGASPGAGVVVALAEGTCGLAEVSRVMSYLARQSAGQCGPCLNGLPRIADQARSLAFRGADRGAVKEMQRLSGLVTGRGACHHPDGSMRFLGSGLRVFASEIALHLKGRCSSTSDAIVLPAPVSRPTISQR